MVSMAGVLAGVMLVTAVVVGENTATLTGWLSDKGCAESKVRAEEVKPNGTVCVKKCLDEGATPVFVHPENRALYELTDYPTLREDVGYHLELTGIVDEKAKTIAVRSVKRLGEVVNICVIPKKKA